MYSLKKGMDGYPKLLQNIKNAPKELYAAGNLQCLDMPCVSIVGSRNMTEYGKNMTKEIVKDLVLGGMCIVSGLAVGIDSVAHKSCIEHGGSTIAVLGSGLNKVYPHENKDLYAEIIKRGGCAISEYEPETEAQKIFFPARNRIVSGLSLATLVIEATYRSGTSITAKFALEQGRQVFCLPNSVGNKNSCGTINLLKKGATLVTSGREVLYELGIIDEYSDFEKLTEIKKINKINLLEQERLKDLDEQAKRVYYHIKQNKVVNLEIMCSELQMNIQDLNMYLTILELKCLIVNKYGSNYSVRDELYV